MQASISLNTREMTRGFDAILTKSNAAIARALNRSIESGKTTMARLIAADMGVKVSDLRDRILVVKATPERHVAELKASAKRIPLYDFGARGPVPSRGRGRGVTIRNPRGSQRLPHAFIAKMASGHTGVFERTGTARLPIQEKFGPSIWLVFVKNRAVGQARALEQLQKNLPHELRFALTRAA
jgi:hypothetical protein